MHQANDRPETEFPRRRVGHVFTIELPPSLVIANRQAFKQLVLDEIDTGARTVRVDCTRLVYADASALGALLSVKRSCVTRGGEFLLCNLASADIATLLRITHMDTVFTFDPPLPEGECDSSP